MSGLVRGAGLLFLGRGLRSALAFGAHAGAARLLGVADYGEFAVVTTLVQIAAFACLRGLSPLTIRHAAGYAAAGELGLLRGYLRWARRQALATSIATAALGAGLLVVAPMPESLRGTLTAGAATLPLATLLLLESARLQAWRPLQADLPEGFVRPVLAFLLLWAAAALSAPPVAATAVIAFGAATGAGITAALLMSRRAAPPGLLETSPQARPEEWRRASLLLFLQTAGTFALSQAGVLVVGARLGAEAAGPYAAAQRISTVAAFSLAAAQAVLPPKVAALRVSGDSGGLQALVTASARLASAGAGVALLLAAGLGPYVLALFGPGFEDAYVPLLILAAGQALGALCGPAGLLLSMTGHERDLAWTLGPCALAGLGLAWGLAGLAGPAGAAAGVVAGSVAGQLLLRRAARSRLRLATGVVGA